MAPSGPLHQLAVESGLGRELEPIVRQIIGGQSREIFYAYLRRIPAEEGARKVASVFTVIDDLLEKAFDTIRALLPELKAEAPRVYNEFKTLPALKEIFKATERKAKQPTAAKRQRAYRVIIKEKWGDGVEEPLRINDNSSRAHYEAMRMLARLTDFLSTNKVIYVIIFGRVSAGQNKLLALTVDILEAANMFQRAAIEEGFILPRLSINRLARAGYRQGNFALVDVATPNFRVYTPEWRVGEMITRTPPRGTNPIRTPGSRGTRGTNTGQGNPTTPGTRTTPAGPAVPPTPETPSGAPVTGPSRTKSGEGGKRPTEQDKDKDSNKKTKTRGTRQNPPIRYPAYNQFRTEFIIIMNTLGPLATALASDSVVGNEEVEQEVRTFMADFSAAR